MSLLELVRSRHVLTLLALVFVGRLPNAMVAVGLVYYARSSGQGWASVGVLTAAYAAGVAVGAPVLARLIDRRGQSVVLVASAAVSSLALLLVPTYPGAAVALVALAGASTPPLEPALRTLWPALLPRAELPRALALDATTQGLIFVAGPLLVLVGTAGFGPRGGLGAAAVLGLVGTVAFACTSPSRSWRPVCSPERPHWAGPLRSRRLLGIYVVVALVGLTMGTLAVALAAYAEVLGDRNLSGWLLAANSCGGFAGGLAFAAAPRWSTGAQVTARIPWIAGAFGLSWAGLAALLPLPAMTVSVVLSGLLLPVLLTSCYVAVDSSRPQARPVKLSAGSSPASLSAHPPAPPQPARSPAPGTSVELSWSGPRPPSLARPSPDSPPALGRTTKVQPEAARFQGECGDVGIRAA